jgi:hypothetical protein
MGAYLKTRWKYAEAKVGTHWEQKWEQKSIVLLNLWYRSKVFTWSHG